MERQRRKEMNDLFSTLFSLVQTKPTTTRLRLPDLLKGATACVKQVQESVESLKELKEKFKHNTPALEVQDMGSTLVVNLITGLDKKFMLAKVLSHLKEEGAEVVNVSYSTGGGRVFYAICCRAFFPRIGLEASSVHERLRQQLFSTM